MRFFLSKPFGLRLYGLGLFLLIATSSSAQHPVFHHYSTGEGLPSPETYMTMQDSKGYIWIGTDHGVARFDGYEFKVFTTDDGLNNNTVFGMYEDEEERIWFFTYSAGISYYKDGEIHKPLGDDFGENWYGANVPYSWTMFKDTLFIGMRNTLGGGGNRFIKIFNDTTHQLDSRTTKPSGSVIMKLDEENYFTTGFPVWHDSIKSRSTLSLVDKDLSEMNLRFFDGSPGRAGFSTFQRNNGDILFTFMGVLGVWTKDTVQILTKLNKATNLGLLEDSKGNIWITLTNGGLYLYRNGDLKTEPELLFENNLTSWVSEDNEGGIWINTLNNGVFYIPSINVLQVPSSRYFKSERLIDFAGQGDTMIVFTKNGFASRLVYKRDEPLDIFTNRSFQEYGTKLHWFKGERPFASGRDRGKTWGYLDPKTLTFTETARKRRAMYGSKINDSVRLVLSSTNRISLHNIKNPDVEDKIIIHATDYNWKCFYPDEETLWLGGLNGLCKFKMGDTSITEIHPENELLRIRIRSINRFKDKLLIATSGHGLVIYEINKDKLWNISTNDGLPSNICNDINFDEEGNVWVSSSVGLSRVSGLNGGAGLFTIQNLDFLSSSISKRVLKVNIQKDIIWVLYDDGLIYFNKKEYDLPESPLVYLNGLEVNHKEYKTSKEVYAYEWDENSIRFEFTGISLQSANKLKYKYRLKGLDLDWNLTQDRSVTYPSLAPGEYEFEVFTQNFSGLWSKQKASQKFEILRSWWNTWWIKTIESFVIISLVVFSIYFYSHRVKQKAEAQNKIDQLKLQALQAQMNPHFVFNVLGAIQSFIASNEAISAQEYLASFATLIRATLNHSVKTWVSLKEEVEVLKMYLHLEAMRFEKPFTYVVELDEYIDETEVYVPTMLLQPFVENAVIHGLSPLKTRGHLQIRISKNEEKLICSILDNGVGRHFKKVESNHKSFHKSYGINITKERLQLFSSKSVKKNAVEFTDLKDIKGNAKGTQVTVIMPYKKTLTHPKT